MKYSNIEQSHWPTGEETDVGGLNGFVDWSTEWSDDSETGGFYSNSQSGASLSSVVQRVRGERWVVRELPVMCLQVYIITSCNSSLKKIMNIL